MSNLYGAGEIMSMLKERVIPALIKKALEIEESDSHILMRLYLAEESSERRKIYYEILRDSEYHKLMLKEGLECLNAEIPPVTEIKDYNFEDMFIDQRLLTLKKIETMARDFYKAVLDDLDMESLEKTCGGETAEKLISIFKNLVKWEEKHIELVDKLMVMD